MTRLGLWFENEMCSHGFFPTELHHSCIFPQNYTILAFPTELHHSCIFPQNYTIPAFSHRITLFLHFPTELHHSCIFPTELHHSCIFPQNYTIPAFSHRITQFLHFPTSASFLHFPAEIHHSCISPQKYTTLAFHWHTLTTWSPIWMESQPSSSKASPPSTTRLPRKRSSKLSSAGENQNHGLTDSIFSKPCPRHVTIRRNFFFDMTVLKELNLGKQAITSHCAILNPHGSIAKEPHFSILTKFSTVYS